MNKETELQHNVSASTTLEPMAFNQVLVQLREFKQLSTRDIADELKISEEKIINIDQGNVGDIPSVYLRDYIRTYAKIVGADQESTENYLKYLAETTPVNKEKNYIKPEKKHKSHKLFWSILILIAVIIGGISAYNYYQDKKEMERIEIGHFKAHPPMPRS